MRKKNLKKGIAFILSALMLVSTVPQAVYALEDSSGQQTVESSVSDDSSDSLIETLDVKDDGSSEEAEQPVVTESKDNTEVSAPSEEETTDVSKEEQKEETAGASESSKSSAAESSKSTTTEVANEAIEEKAEEKELFTEIADDSLISEEALGSLDFSSKRLLILGDIIDPENELSSYDGIHLMQYKDAKTARNAYSYYYGKAELVEPDSVMSVATGEGSESDVADVMTESDNPFTELEKAGSSNGGSNVIALIDTGVNGDVSSKVSMIGDNTGDDNGHGTRMAELIKSTNPDAKIMSIKALGADGNGDASAIIAAIKYATENNAGIINLSISALKNSDSELVAKVVAEAEAHGIKVVTAAGNRSMDASHFIPASIDGVITIGAADKNGERLASSNYGDCVEYNVVADSTSEAAAIYSGLLSMGKGDIDNKMVFSVDYKVTEGPEVTLHVNFYDANVSFDKVDGGEIPTEANIWTDGCETTSTIEGDIIKVKILDDAEDTNSMYNLGVFTDFGHVGSEADITSECSFDKETMTVSIPVSYKDADVTIRWYQSSESYLYANVCPDEYKAVDVSDKFSVAWLTEGTWNTASEYGTTLLGINQYTVTSNDYNSFAVGSKWNVTAADIAYLSQYSDVNGNLAGYYNLDSPQAIGIRSVSGGPSVSFFSQVGKSATIRTRLAYKDSKTASTGNYIIGTCGGATAGENPVFTGGYVKCMSKSGTSASFFVYISVSAGQAQAASFTVTFKPSAGYLNIRKTSTNTAVTNGNSCYSLEGAQYGVYSDATCTDLKATITTDANGNSGSVKLIAGTYYVKEITAPKGYNLNSTVYTLSVASGQTTTGNVEDTPYNDPLRVLVQKLDSETGKASKRLAGAQYTVKYYDVESEDAIATATPKRTWVFETDENGIIRLANAYKISGDDLYTATSSGTPVLPIGYITIQETKEPDAYLIDETIYVCKTEYATGITTTNLPVDKEAVNEAPKRGDLEFTKVSERTGRPLYGVPFEIKNNETGESHIIVTDENGYASTASDHNSHSKNTNRGKNSHDGVWFGELTALNESKGALPYGTYTITELESYANYGMDLVEFSVTISENNVVVNAGDVTNLTIDISTTAFSTSTGIKSLPVGESEEITDIVSYANLTVGRTYKMKASVVDKETEEVVANGEVEFTPGTTAGTVNVPISIDTTKLAGKTLVVFEELYQGTSKRQDHTSLADSEQTVYIPAIGTTAADNATKDHVGIVSDKTVIRDTVSYKNLVTGKEYTVKGILMDKETGNALTINGKEVTAEKNFTPDTIDGEVTLTFEFDSSTLAGKTVVVFEDLYYEDVQICSHADIEDEDQTVEYPGIGTSAVDSKTKDGQGVTDKEENVIDIVNYKNLIVGKEYTVKGVLMDKQTGKAIIADGKEITAETTFTAEQADGSVELTYTLDTSVLAGKTVVVFEDLYHNGVEVVSHSDIDDEDQSVHYPKVHTTAINKDSDEHIGNVNKEVTITDTVSYTNLITGKEYTVKGTLMDKETGKSLLVDGKEITAEASFTAEKTDGEISLTFMFDASSLDGKTVVVYEDLYHNGVRICTHSDITDEDQSIHYPKLKTAAINNDTETHVGNVAEKVTITDTVSYSNLIIGKEYTVKGTLMDKETGEPLIINDEKVTAENTFTPDELNGTVDLVYELDATDLTGKTVVVFEDLYYEDVQICSHADIEDEDQSVHYPKIGTSAADSLTGDDQGIAAESETLIDTVSYTNLVVGEEYTLKGILMDKETGEALLVDGEVVTAETVFTPEESDGSVDVEFSFNSLAVKGKTTVVFEELYNNDVLVTTHSDIEDEEQTVVIPEIHTTAINKDTDTHVGNAAEKVTITDTVSYSNLIIGNEYTVKGVLMDKETDASLKVDGKEVTAEATFTAEEPDGEVELTYELNASDLAGKTVVVFESLYYNDVEVYTHADIEDEAQSIYYPQISTTATTNGQKEATVTDNLTISDKVKYENLVIGETYTVKGVLMDKTTGKTIIVNGREVTAESTFKAENTDGEISIDFTFNASSLGGHSVVVFEEIYHNNVLLTGHQDINDEGQTVKLNDVPVVPKTGDTTNVMSWLVLLGVAAFAAGFIFSRRKRAIKNK